jgi:hypothetical protein
MLVEPVAFGSPIVLPAEFSPSTMRVSTVLARDRTAI